MDDGSPAEPAVDMAGGLLTVADSRGHRAIARHRIAAGEQPRVAGHHGTVHDHRVIGFEHDAGDAFQEAAVSLLAKRPERWNPL